MQWPIRNRLLLGLRAVRQAVWLFGDRLVCRFISKREHAGVLFVRTDAIGDFVLWLSTAQRMREVFPQQKITLIANSAWASWARSMGFCDDVWSVDVRRFVKSPLYRWKLQRRISSAGFALAVQPTFSRVLLVGDAMVRASAARTRIGFDGDLANRTLAERRLGDKWYTSLIAAPSEDFDELSRNAFFALQAFGKPLARSTGFIPVRPPLFGLKTPFFVIFPGSGWQGRNWPPQRFAKTIQLLTQAKGWQPVLCGAAAEAELADYIGIMSGVTCVNLAGKTSLQDLADILAKAELLISNETSAVHISAAVGTPVVTVTGGGHFGRFLPYAHDALGIAPTVVNQKMPCYGCNWVCSQVIQEPPAMPCISGVTVEAVLQGCDRALESATKRIANIHSSQPSVS